MAFPILTSGTGTPPEASSKRSSTSKPAAE